jgi:serine/threonine-protein kinase
MASAERPAPARARTVGRLDPSATGEDFSPGQVLASRYRIIGLLGRGGMGEVYRADDLKLGQPVSLKFLPARLSTQPALLAAFHAEVRNARQVSHPNVCRVYDIDDLDGRHFLTMEYVDGEDLATLLHRIGRLPSDKANQVARQLCAGLAAAHERGVIHRDLKPSNVMIDGHGRVRITDFGLAVRTDETSAGEVAGTPAYMAPEQFGGAPVTEHSDVYALGLILYEIYTGRRPFDASSLPEWRSRHLESQPVPPSTREGEIDPAVERVILRCLEKDPSRRPASALQVAAALPGGDPLAAALAAGETPSPEMVAAAGGEGALTPRAAMGIYAATILIVAALIGMAPYATDFGLSGPPASPEVLRDRARQALAAAGHVERPLDTAGWYERDYGWLKHRADQLGSKAARSEMRRWPPPVRFRYRQSPRWLHPTSTDGGRVTADEPAHEVSGMASVVLDGRGQLRSLRVEPVQLDTTELIAPLFQWGPLFTHAGLDLGAFEPAKPTWVPPVFSERRHEWTGRAPWAPDVTLRVTAAEHRGDAVYFEVLGPWSRPARMERPDVPLTRRISDVAIAILFGLSFVIAMVFGRRNLRLGRGDKRGAMRFAGFTFVAAFVYWPLQGHHVPDFELEAGATVIQAGIALFAAGTVAMLYLAIEPYVRRKIPEVMIGWARVLEGQWRSPRVARDVLIGGLVGAFVALVVYTTNGLPTWLQFHGQTPLYPHYEFLVGGLPALDAVIGSLTEGIAPSFSLLALYFVLRLALKPPGFALGGVIVVAMLAGLGGENPALETPGALVIGTLIAVTLVRFGVLAAVAAFGVWNALLAVPLPVAAGAPYTVTCALVLMGLVALLAVAMRLSWGTRRVVVDPLER